MQASNSRALVLKTHKEDLPIYRNSQITRLWVGISYLSTWTFRETRVRFKEAMPEKDLPLTAVVGVAAAASAVVGAATGVAAWLPWGARLGLRDRYGYRSRKTGI